MAAAKPATVSEYLDGLPGERRKSISRVRSAVKKNLPKGYSEGMYYGMIAWHIPLADYPDTYNGQPLCIASLASHKNYCSLYLTAPYADPAQLATLEEGFRRAGKKLSMGKSCVNFKSADELALDAIGQVIASTPPQRLVEFHERAHGRKRGTARRDAAKRR